MLMASRCGARALACLAAVALLLPLAASAHTPPVALKLDEAAVLREPRNGLRTPPLGFNTWNKFGCSVNASILTETADAFVRLGLRDLNYTWVNSDDCWMIKERNATTNAQVANRSKFPDGVRTVADYIHSLGLSMGLYTARAPTSCAGFAGSCRNEVSDVQQWAEWHVSYMKDDSCGHCRGNASDPVSAAAGNIADYRVMQQAIDASGRPMVLTIEGGPDITEVHTGCCGQARRVGGDIEATWPSAMSLVDLGSGLWPFAHNGSRNTHGTDRGFFNDLDCLELGNGDFKADRSPLHAAQARSMYSLWSLLKAPMLLGTDLRDLDDETLDIIRAREVIEINQDAWGKQAQRIASFPAANQTLALPHHAMGVMARCNSSRPTQRWWYRTSSTSAPSMDRLFISPCNSSDGAQRFVLPSANVSVLRSSLTGDCLGGDSQSGFPPVERFRSCIGDASQRVTLGVDERIHVGKGNSSCLMAWSNHGPNVYTEECLPAGAPGWGLTAQQFSPRQQDARANELSGSMIRSRVKGHSSDPLCLTVRGPRLHGSLHTTDQRTGQAWCLGMVDNRDTSMAVPCDPAHGPPSIQTSWSIQHGANDTTQLLCDPSLSGRPSGLGFGNDQFGSGPLPHTRWMAGGNAFFKFDSTSAAGSSIESSHAGIFDNDSVGHAESSSSPFCLELSPSSSLEVWASVLSGVRWGVGLLNRSPSSDNITVDFAKLPELNQSASVGRGQTFEVRDVWADTTLTGIRDSYTATVGPHDVALLVLTPRPSREY